jgi:hypothetical protein
MATRPAHPGSKTEAAPPTISGIRLTNNAPSATGPQPHDTARTSDETMDERFTVLEAAQWPTSIESSHDCHCILPRRSMQDMLIVAHAIPTLTSLVDFARRPIAAPANLSFRHSRATGSVASLGRDTFTNFVFWTEARAASPYQTSTMARLARRGNLASTLHLDSGGYKAKRRLHP